MNYESGEPLSVLETAKMMCVTSLDNYNYTKGFRNTLCSRVYTLVKYLYDETDFGKRILDGIRFADLANPYIHCYDENGVDGGMWTLLCVGFNKDGGLVFSYFDIHHNFLLREIVDNTNIDFLSTFLNYLDNELKKIEN